MSDHNLLAEAAGFLYGGTPPSEPVATSEEAAASIAPHLQPLQERVMAAFVAVGDDGLIDDELEVATGLRHQTASARRRELYLLGRLAYKRDSAGNKVRRRTRSGRWAFVFVAK
jgi:hypothetical protein